MSDTVLIVEEERELMSTLQSNLQSEGYQTQCAASGNRALEIVSNNSIPNLVLLDLMLSDLSGLELCRRLRSLENTKDVPLVMLGAKDDEIDRVVGFEVGADDYLVKPFSFRELVLRIKAVLRRGTKHQTSDRISDFGRVHVDRHGYRVWVDDGEVFLTALEFRLLVWLLDHRGSVQSRDKLLKEVWKISATTHTRTVDTHIKRLRVKLGLAGGYIETLRGVGYRFRDASK